ncbi:unnamed protein product [Ascophyllum nodosum]
MSRCSHGASWWPTLCLCLAFFTHKYALAFILTSPFAARAPIRPCSGAGCPGFTNLWVGSRTRPGLGMSAGGSAMGSASTLSTGEEEGMRLDQIQGFADKVLEGMAAQGMESGFMSIFGEFLEGYTNCAKRAGTTPEQFQECISTLIKMVPENVKEPYKFELFHPATKDPLDLYTWGNDFFRPLVEMDKSLLAGKENLDKIVDYLAKGENVFLLSDHQTEADPQVISLLMEREGYGKLASGLVDVAGHRVTTDPLAIPFSMGRNLLWIFSKKYTENPPSSRARSRSTTCER